MSERLENDKKIRRGRQSTQKMAKKLVEEIKKNKKIGI